MQHLIRRNVIQNDTDGLGGVQTGWHWNQFALRQADELRIRAVYGHRGNDLAQFESGDTVAEPLYLANQVPARRIGHRGRFGMNALARHYVGQGDACGQHSHADFTILRLGALFFNHPKGVGPAVVSDDDARVSHGPRLSLLGTRTLAASCPRSAAGVRATRAVGTAEARCSAILTTCCAASSLSCLGSTI